MRTQFQFFEKNISLNTSLIAQQNLSQSEVDEVLRLHVIKRKIQQRMKELDNEQSSSLRFFAQTLRQIEFQLQKAWHFPLNENYHRWFEAPHCSCPRLDNIEKLGTPYSVINTQCVLHNQR